MFKTQKQQVSYLTLKQRITAGVMAFFMLGQICFPAVAAAAYLTSDETITQALSSNFFERASTSSYLYQKSDLAYSGNLSNQNIASFHKRLVDNKISLPAPTYIPIAGDITIIVPHQPVGKLVGDVYVQNRLVRQQVFNQLGRHLIDPENNDSEFVQINKLYNNAYVYAQRTGKIYGTKLSASDVAYLNSQGLDVLWPEHRLIDGATVVVPILYLTENTVATQSVNDHVIEFFGEHNQLGSVTISNQSLRLGRESFLAVRDVKLVNGTIKSEGNIAIQATGNISALGSVIDAKSSLNLHVGGVFSLIDGSQVVANNNVDIYAGQVHLKTLVHLFTDRYGQGTRLSEISAITANGNITVNSSQDITLEASKITSSNGAITLSAGTNINILPVVTQYSSEYKVGDWGVSQNSLNAIGSSISANDTIKLIAGGAINITASELTSTQGGVELLAANGIHILDSLDQTSISKEDRKGKTKGTASEFISHAVRSILYAGKGVLLDTDSGDVTLRAAQITSSSGTKVRAHNGGVHMLMTKELEESHLQTVRKGTWTIKTRTEDIVHENNVQNAIIGGLEVEALTGINIEYTGKQGASLKQQLEEYAKMPEMSWMADLYNKCWIEKPKGPISGVVPGNAVDVTGSVEQCDGATINWDAVEEIHEEIRESNSTLSPAAMAIIAICVAVAMGPMGAGLLGSGGGAIGVSTAAGVTSVTATGAILQAGALTLATQATQSLAAGNNLRETLNAMDSDESLKSLAISMATAGALSAVDGLNLFDVPSTASPVTQFASQAGQAIVNSTVSAGIAVTINGGNSDDYLDAFNSALLVNAVNTIGNNISNKIANAADFSTATKYIAHAAMGCLTGSLTNEIQDADVENGCASGAGGAVIGQATADLIEARIRNWAENTRNGGFVSYQSVETEANFLLAHGVDLSKLSAAFAAFALGGDVNTAAGSAEAVAAANIYKATYLLDLYRELNGEDVLPFNATRAERFKSKYKSDIREVLTQKGIASDVIDTLIAKLEQNDVLDSLSAYDENLLSDGSQYDVAAKYRSNATFYEEGTLPTVHVTGTRPGESYALEFLAATNKAVSSFSPLELQAAEIAYTVITGGPIKAAITVGINYGYDKLMPAELLELKDQLTHNVSLSGVAFLGHSSFGETKDAYSSGEWAVDETDGLAWIVENVTGISPGKRGTNTPTYISADQHDSNSSAGVTGGKVVYLDDFQRRSNFDEHMVKVDKVNGKYVIEDGSLSGGHKDQEFMTALENPRSYTDEQLDNPKFVRTPGDEMGEIVGDPIPIKDVNGNVVGTKYAYKIPAINSDGTIKYDELGNVMYKKESSPHTKSVYDSSKISDADYLAATKRAAQHAWDNDLSAYRNDLVGKRKVAYLDVQSGLKFEMFFNTDLNTKQPYIGTVYLISP
ncbi:DUF637 domain-containing protein [Cellvibrio sp. PSBB006]|uniref:DUF637 domain-containing protein n=1 Tax=Cellvibrio sp. PSBB006 TaxID=1987723 RepID=UPI000B3B13D1|nr:DUF637 domain-containing protein [Cellvibrio sp. PSBB006]ARU27546.1 hypothetical protein CBR65_08900 [Cellvibrio sp. PSBB006]